MQHDIKKFYLHFLSYVKNTKNLCLISIFQDNKTLKEELSTTPILYVIEPKFLLSQVWHNFGFAAVILFWIVFFFPTTIFLYLILEGFTLWQRQYQALVVLSWYLWSQAQARPSHNDND